MTVGRSLVLVTVWCLLDAGVVTPLYAAPSGPVLVVHPTTHAPTIDGILADEAWRSSTAAELQWTNTDSLVDEAIRSTAWAVHDDRCVYAAFRSREPNVGALVVTSEKHDDVLLPQGDDVEVFIEPANSGEGHYFQIAVNIRNVTYTSWQPSQEMAGQLARGELPRAMALLALPYQTTTDWEPQGLVTAVRVGSHEWCAEMAIPFADLMVKPPEAGQAWGWNFARHARGAGDVWTTWSRTGYLFLNPGAFGSIVFAQR